MTTTNMEEVPLSPSKLNSNLKSPSLRVRSPSAKSNIAISRGDDDSSIDDDRPKMCVSDGSTITCVFNKKRLFGGSAFALVAVVVIMAVAIATRSDGGSSSSSANHMSKVATVGGGNSNAAVGTAEVGSAAPPPKVAPVAPKVVPVAPAKSNFAFVAPNSGIGGGSAAGSGYYGGKSGKSGRSCSSSDFMRSFNPLTDDLWSGSGKSGKSGSNHCSFGSSGKSGKSGSSSLVCDAWHGSSGKSGKSNSVPIIPGVSKVYQNVRSGCFATPTALVPYSTNPLQGQGYAGVITPGETYCGQLAKETGVSQANNVIQRYFKPNYNFGIPNLDLTQTIDSYLFRVGCDESVYSFLLNSKQNFVYTPPSIGQTQFDPAPLVLPIVRRIPDADIDNSYSGKSGKSGRDSPKITCDAKDTVAYDFTDPEEIPSSVFIDIPVFGTTGIPENPPSQGTSGTSGYSLELDPGLYEVTVINSFEVLPGAGQLVGTCDAAANLRQPFDYTLKVIPGTLVGN